MARLNALYQELILEHNRAPHNYRPMENANRRVEGNNPLCGDRFVVWLRMEGDLIADVTFQGLGCAISTASASLMTSAIKGKTRAEAEALFDRFLAMITGSATEQGKAESLGKLVVFSGVAEFPIKVKCASLSWHAMKVALEQPNAVVSTE
jgi:nitrogen fixation protein NifU and related proteins